MEHSTPTYLRGRNKSKKEITQRNWMMNRLALDPAGTSKTYVKLVEETRIVVIVIDI